MASLSLIIPFESPLPLLTYQSPPTMTPKKGGAKSKARVKKKKRSARKKRKF